VSHDVNPRPREILAPLRFTGHWQSRVAKQYYRGTVAVAVLTLDCKILLAELQKGGVLPVVRVISCTFVHHQNKCSDVLHMFMSSSHHHFTCAIDDRFLNRCLDHMIQMGPGVITFLRLCSTAA